MFSALVHLKPTRLPFLIALCAAGLTATSVFASGVASPSLATDVLGSPDAAVNGKFAVGSASVGSKAMTVSGVIDFLGAGTVHNYFTQGAGNNMQINTNIDEANAVSDASKSQWKLVLGSSLDQFSIRRSPAGATYNEDALFFIDGSTGNVGIATVDTGNGASIPFSPSAKLHVQTTSGGAVFGRTTATAGSNFGVYGRSDSTSGMGVYGNESATTGTTYGVYGRSDSTNGRGVFGAAFASTGSNYGVYGNSDSTSGRGVYGEAYAATGATYGVFGRTNSTEGYGVYGWATPTTGFNCGVFGQNDSTTGRGVYGYATATIGTTYGVMGRSDATDGYGVYGVAASTTGYNYGVFGVSYSTNGRAVYGYATTSTGTNYGVYGRTLSTAGFGVYGYASPTTATGINYGVYGMTNSTDGFGVYYVGGLAGTGTKSAIVDTRDYGWRTLYAMESPQNWFEDFGQATLASGETVVPIDPIFAQTVNLKKPYHVFLTPQDGFCSLYVTDKSSSSFTVRALEGASCEITFDYRIIAPRLDYEDLRLKPAADPQAVTASMPEPPSAPEGPQAP
jgi:hypothetical protein